MGNITRLSFDRRGEMREVEASFWHFIFIIFVGYDTEPSLIKGNLSLVRRVSCICRVFRGCYPSATRGASAGPLRIPCTFYF